MLFEERKNIWLLMTNTRNKMHYYPLYYQKLSSELLDPLIERDLDQIKKDEHRTQIKGDCD